MLPSPAGNCLLRGTVALLPVFVWAVGGPVAAQAPELRRVRALLVIDTRSGLGESVELDGRRMMSVLRTGLPKDRLDVTTLTGAKVSRATILSYYRNLATGPDEALLFYYAGHGATDPDKGHFLALQELKTEPLTRADLKEAMRKKRPGLVVILTDCCSDRYELKKKNRDIWSEEHREVNPVLRDLLLRHRGVVDVTASTGNEAFGDEHQGGLFTRNLGRLLLTPVRDLDTNGDGFVDWSEFFPRLQHDTERSFVSWAREHRSLGEDIDQKSQRPRALQLPGDAGTAGAVTVRNHTDRMIAYEYRWQGTDAWTAASLEPRKSATHAVPAALAGKDVRLEIRSKEGTGRFRPGETARFHD
jgi:hypothetical protein